MKNDRNGKKIVQGSPEALITQYQTNNLENVFIKLTGNQVRD